MPSWDIFEHQSRDYQNSVLPPEVEARVALEQASTFGWERYVGARGRVIGMHTFGASAPLKELQKKFGFEPDQVVAVAKELLRERGLRHSQKICADKTSVPSAGNQSGMTPAQQPNRQL
jgi:transketolase